MAAEGFNGMSEVLPYTLYMIRMEMPNRAACLYAQLAIHRPPAVDAACVAKPPTLHVRMYSGTHVPITITPMLCDSSHGVPRNCAPGRYKVRAASSRYLGGNAPALRMLVAADATRSAAAVLPQCRLAHLDPSKYGGRPRSSE
jgi:hypothetical protein